MSARTSRSRFCGFCNSCARIYVIICGLRACKRVGAHKLFAMLGAVQFLLQRVVIYGVRAYNRVGAHKSFAILWVLNFRVHM